MSIFIKSLNKVNSRFSVNEKPVGIKCSSELTDIEDKQFKTHLKVLKLI